MSVTGLSFRFIESGGVYKLAFGPKAFVVVSDPVVVRHLLKVPHPPLCAFFSYVSSSKHLGRTLSLAPSPLHLPPRQWRFLHRTAQRNETRHRNLPAKVVLFQVMGEEGGEGLPILGA